MPKASVESDDDLPDVPPPPPPPVVSRPAAVAAAIRVLEVQEQLEVPLPQSTTQLPPTPQMNDTMLADGEKALLRQMCNVSYGKLIIYPSCFNVTQDYIFHLKLM